MKPLWETVTKALLNSRDLLLALTPATSHLSQSSNKASQAQFALAKSMRAISGCPLVLFVFGNKGILHDLSRPRDEAMQPTVT